jgi:O-glycosyl hydrolase
MTRSERNAVRGLLRIFRRNGYVRRRNPRRYRAEGYRRYKKGDEIRLVANSKKELAVIRKWLTQAGFNAARPFAKGKIGRAHV